jgi:succinoglycan biosynthesis transport protein ExoP
MVLAIYYAYFVAVPMYRSTAVVILQTKQDNIVDLQSVAGGFSGDSTEVNTEVEVLKSRGLGQKVVERLNLIQDPDFNSALREPSLVGSAIGAIRSTVRPADLDEIQQGEVLRKNRIRDNVTARLQSQVSVSNIRQSLVFNVSVETQSPIKSAQITAPRI